MIRRSIFTKFSPCGRYLIVDYRSDPLFPIAHRRLWRQHILRSTWAKSADSPLVVTSAFGNGLEYRNFDFKRFDGGQSGYIVCKFGEYRSSNPGVYKGRRRAPLLLKINPLRQIISRSTWPIFTISPCGRYLTADKNMILFFRSLKRSCHSNEF